MVPLPIHATLVNDRDRWNTIVRSFPAHHVLQSWEWGVFKSRSGWVADRLAFNQGDRVVAAAQVLTRRARPLLVSIMYVPRGPLLDHGDDRSLLAAVLDALVAHGKSRNAIFVKIDPDVVLGTGVPGTAEEATDPAGVAFQSNLVSRGWSFSEEQIQFRNTVQLDLTQTKDDLLAAMKQKTRYNIRLADRKGVQVRVGDMDDVELLFRMYAETAARDQFIIRPLAYYRDAWGRFIESGLACPLIAEFESEPIAALILFCLGDRAWYMYGSSRDVHRDKMPNHRLQWEAICWAKSQGHSIYDMWGAPDTFAEDDSMWGVWRFKAGFGGRVVRHIGAWDKTLSRPWRWIYTAVIPRYLTLRRSMSAFHRRRQTR